MKNIHDARMKDIHDARINDIKSCMQGENELLQEYLLMQKDMEDELRLEDDPRKKDRIQCKLQKTKKNIKRCQDSLEEWQLELNSLTHA